MRASSDLPFVRSAWPAWLLGATLAGCSTGAAPPSSSASAPAVLEAAGDAPLVVAGSRSGAQIVLKRGQVLQVELVDDAGSVAGGYAWTIDANDPAVLAPSAPSFERASRDVNAFESAGTTVWRLVPRSAGTVALAFALRRPRTLDAPLETVRFTVLVR